LWQLCFLGGHSIIQVALYFGNGKRQRELLLVEGFAGKVTVRVSPLNTVSTAVPQSEFWPWPPCMVKI
jgi:hypothetical protein